MQQFFCVNELKEGNNGLIYSFNCVFYFWFVGVGEDIMAFWNKNLRDAIVDIDTGVSVLYVNM